MLVKPLWSVVYIQVEIGDDISVIFSLPSSRTSELYPQTHWNVSGSQVLLYQIHASREDGVSLPLAGALRGEKKDPDN